MTDAVRNRITVAAEPDAIMQVIADFEARWPRGSSTLPWRV